MKVLRWLVTGPIGIGKSYIMNEVRNYRNRKNEFAICDTDSFFTTERREKLESITDGQSRIQYYKQVLTDGFLNYESCNPSTRYIYFGRIEDPDYVPPFKQFTKMIVLLEPEHIHFEYYLNRASDRIQLMNNDPSKIVEGSQPFFDEFNWLSKRQLQDDRQIFQKLIDNGTHEQMNQRELYVFLLSI